MPCDYSNYPADWKLIRAAILARAGNRCEQCRSFFAYLEHLCFDADLARWADDGGTS